MENKYFSTSNISIGTYDFIVHIKKEYDNRLTGVCVESVDGKYLSANKSMEGVDNIKDARVWFTWSFVWRGEWEGRIYPVEQEFWAEELDVMKELWIKITPGLKEIIKNNKPDYPWSKFNE